MKPFFSCIIKALIITLGISTIAHATIVVDASGGLDANEVEYLVNWQPNVSSALRNFIDQQELPDEYMPHVAFCASGGGYRAAICFLGFLLGAQAIGLTDAVTHAAALSGSTWLLGNQLVRNVPLEALSDIFRAHAATSFWDPATLETEAIVAHLRSVLTTTHTLRPADIWGAIVADRLYGDVPDAQELTFAPIREILKASTRYQPFPLFTTVITEHVDPYEWITVSPFTVSSDFLCAAVPTGAFGSPFSSGACEDDALLPEISLGTFLGTFGSPYELSWGDILKFTCQALHSEWFNRLIETLSERWGLTKRRMLPSLFNNFIHEMAQHPLNTIPKLSLTDAGMDFNLPFPPLLKPERAINVIIVCDASNDAADRDYPELQYARDYARRKGLPFPSLRAPRIITPDLVIFQDRNSCTPTIIYFTNTVAEPTLKLTYTPEEFDELCQSMMRLVSENKPAIAEAIKQKAAALATA